MLIDQVYTEQYGTQKFGAFWMDYVYGMEVTRETDDSKKSLYHIIVLSSQKVMMP